jgi:hypothetical protein
MKRPTRTKLTIRLETLRSLAAAELSNAVGGVALNGNSKNKEVGCFAALEVISPPRD